MKTSKAPGSDQIPNRILKECASHSELAPGLSTIFQRSVDTGCLPNDWTYRLVSLTSMLCKLLEHIICRHLLSHLAKEKILTDLNHGFRAGFSCEAQLVTTLHDLCKNFEAGKQTDIAILDFSKAFDTVPHSKLLHKLSSYEIGGKLHCWLKNFLTKRKMKVVVEGEESAELPVDWRSTRHSARSHPVPVSHQRFAICREVTGMPVRG